MLGAWWTADRTPLYRDLHYPAGRLINVNAAANARYGDRQADERTCDPAADATLPIGEGVTYNFNLDFSLIDVLILLYSRILIHIVRYGARFGNHLLRAFLY